MEWGKGNSNGAGLRQCAGAREETKNEVDEQSVWQCAESADLCR